MASLFPSIFPYAPDSPEMKKLGMQTEFEVYTKLGSTYDETVDILCEPKFIKRDYFGRMRDGEYTDFIILHPQKGKGPFPKFRFHSGILLLCRHAQNLLPGWGFLSQGLRSSHPLLLLRCVVLFVLLLRP